MATGETHSPATTDRSIRSDQKNSDDTPTPTQLSPHRICNSGHEITRPAHCSRRSPLSGEKPIAVCSLPPLLSSSDPATKTSASSPFHPVKTHQPVTVSYRRPPGCTLPCFLDLPVRLPWPNSNVRRPSPDLHSISNRSQYKISASRLVRHHPDDPPDSATILAV
ncbi:hypothetical protein ACLOJK_028455 [Asimina triloba]